MKKILIPLMVLMFAEVGFCIEAYSPADSVPLCATLTTGDFLYVADADSVMFFRYRLSTDGTFTLLDSVTWDSDSSWGKIGTGEICRWVSASDEFGNPGLYHGIIRAFRGDTTDSKIVSWIVKVSKVDSLTFRTNPFVYDYGYIFQDFEDTARWASTCSLEVPDYQHRTEGYQGIRITTANGDSGSITKTISEWFGDEADSCWAGNFTIAVYDTFQPKWGSSYNQRMDSIIIIFSSTSDFSKQMRVRLNQWDFVSEWNKFVFHHTDFTAYGGEVWNNHMIRLQIRVWAHSGDAAVLTFDEMRYGYRGEPTVIFTLDDDAVEQLPWGVRYSFEPNNIKATFTIVCETMNPVVDDTFDIIYEKGHEIANQGWGFDFIPSSLYWTASCTVRAEVNKCKNYIAQHGWKEEPRTYAFNAGWWSKLFFDALKPTSYMARTDANDDYQAHIELDGRQWYVKAHPMGIDTSLTRAKTLVDECRKRGSLLIFIFHGLDTTGLAGTEWHADSLRLLSRYVDSLRTEGQLSCMRLCDYYGALESGSYIKSRMQDRQADWIAYGDKILWPADGSANKDSVDIFDEYGKKIGILEFKHNNNSSIIDTVIYIDRRYR